MSCSRKDYKAIAEIFEKNLPYGDTAADMRVRLAQHISSYFAEQNDLFDEDKFLRACGVL